MGLDLIKPVNLSEYQVNLQRHDTEHRISGHGVESSRIGWLLSRVFLRGPEESLKPSAL